MEIKNLQSFLRIVELGTFTKAAESLGYAQSTITAQIQALESELGYPLFERIGKKNILTSNGQQLASYANQLLKIEEKIRLLGNDSPTEIKGFIRIGTVESFLNYAIINIINSYQKRFPNIKIQIKIANTNTLVDMLRHNVVDAIFSVGEDYDISDLVRVNRQLESAVFISSVHHPLAAKESVTLPELLAYPFITLNKDTFLHQKLERAASDCGGELISNIEVDSSQLAISLVRKNLGLAFLPKRQISVSPVLEEIRIIPVENFSFSFYMNIFHHKNKWLTPPMVAFFDIIQEYIAGFKD